MQRQVMLGTLWIPSSNRLLTEQLPQELGLRLFGARAMTLEPIYTNSSCLNIMIHHHGQ